MFKNASVNVHQFSMVPRADIPRSSFRRQSVLKTAFDSGYLVPIFLDEVLPGDSFNLNMTAFARLATPLFPFMDNLKLETFFFFVPCRLVWDNWVRMQGEQDDPDDSIDYIVPSFPVEPSGFAVSSIFDYFGLPTAGQYGAFNSTRVSTLPLRAYNKIFNDWFRDQNLVDSVLVRRTDGSDGYSDFTLLRRAKRHDYFASCLPWTQKGNNPVTIPLAGSAPVKGIGWAAGAVPGASGSTFRESGGDTAVYGPAMAMANVSMNTTTSPANYYPTIYADLTEATGATINQLRQSFQIQRMLERNARGGSRYTELNFSHFGVKSPDARLQRSEYLGGGSSDIIVNPIAQTSGTDVTGSTTPQGNLSGMATALARRHGFSQSFTEHGYIIGLANVRADLTYQQGVRKLWFRSTLYDFYRPVFANLGEQAVLNKEIYCDGDTTDEEVFGYQERWAEYRHFPSMVTGLMRSTAANTIDAWHLAQRFSAVPTLNQEFIEENPPVQRVVAVGAAAGGQEFIMDAFFDINTARAMPLYSVPGLIDHL